MNDEEQRAAKARKKEHEAKFRAATQAVMKDPNARFLLGEFFAAAAIDVSPRRDTDRLTYHAIGWMDAGSWWLDAIRRHCPEREATIRTERIAYMKEAAPPAPQDDDEDG